MERNGVGGTTAGGDAGRCIDADVEEGGNVDCVLC
jgi:hypothetical protein